MTDTITIKGRCYSKEVQDQMLSDFYNKNKMIFCKAFRCSMSEDKCKEISLKRIEEINQINSDFIGFKVTTPCLSCKQSPNPEFNPDSYQSESKICRLAEDFSNLCPSNVDDTPGKFYINATFTASNFKNTRYCCTECKHTYNRIKRLWVVFKKNKLKIPDIDPTQTWSEKEFANFLCITKNTIANWRIAETVKPFASSGGKRGFLYRGQDLIDLMKYLKID